MAWSFNNLMTVSDKHSLLSPVILSSPTRLVIDKIYKQTLILSKTARCSLGGDCSNSDAAASLPIIHCDRPRKPPQTLQGAAINYFSGA